MPSYINESWYKASHLVTVALHIIIMIIISIATVSKGSLLQWGISRLPLFLRSHQLLWFVGGVWFWSIPWEARVLAPMRVLLCYANSAHIPFAEVLMSSLHKRTTLKAHRTSNLCLQPQSVTSYLLLIVLFPFVLSAWSQRLPPVFKQSVIQGFIPSCIVTCFKINKIKMICENWNKIDKFPQN